MPSHCHLACQLSANMAYTHLMMTRRAFVPSNWQGPIRPLATGAMFPASVDVLVYDLDNDDRVVTLSLRSIDGQPVLVGLAFGHVHPSVARELKATDVHSLPVKELTREAIRVVGLNVADATPFPFRRDNPAAEGDSAVRAQRRRGFTDAELEDVARVAQANPEAPIEAVFRELAGPSYYSYRTAARWVAEARKRGFLPPSARRAKNKSEEDR